MITINGKDRWFVAISNGGDKPKYKTYMFMNDGSVFLKSTCDSYKEWQDTYAASSDHGTPGITKQMMDAALAAVITQVQVQTNNQITRAEAYTALRREKTYSLINQPRMYLNCTQLRPTQKMTLDVRSDTWFLDYYDDITIRYDNTVRARSQLLEDFFSQIENGDYILYYLNEFRNIRKIPILCFAGTGGSGKTMVAQMFCSYKEDVCTSFFAEKYTGVFGKTSLVFTDEADESSCERLNLNVVKRMQTSTEHDIRIMHTDPTKAYGFPTFVFCSNDNRHSKFLELLNSKGEDVTSMKRRISTFYFDDANNAYMENRGGDFRGPLLAQTYKIAQGATQRTTELDAHLNYLEDIGFFNNPKFVKNNPLHLVIHSKRIPIGDRLSNGMSNLLAALHESFIQQGRDVYVCNFNPKEHYEMVDGYRRELPLPKIEKYLKDACSKADPSLYMLKQHINAVAKDCFKFGLTYNNPKIEITNPEKLISIYKRYLEQVGVNPEDIEYEDKTLHLQ